jgi:uncharacterized protein (DUF1499 family)
MKNLVSLMSVLAFLLVTLPGPLYKFGVLALGPAFTGIRFGVYAGIAALVLLLLYIVFKRKTVSWRTAGISGVLAIFAVALPVSLITKAKSVPPIHDISTDLANPPAFVAITALRADAPNPVEYAGEETATQQRKAYPELTTTVYQQNFEHVFTAANNAITTLGMTIVSADKTNGIIEATATTTWFGFKDDVIIRIQDTGEQRLLDVRSKSRVGKSDLGKNAERITALLTEINASL